jgi:hypothetical protein
MFFEPECIVGRLDCAGSQDVAEFGCGYGLFTVPTARAVTGTVYALIKPTRVALTSQGGQGNVRVVEQGFLAGGG